MQETRSLDTGDRVPTKGGRPLGAKSYRPRPEPLADRFKIALSNLSINSRTTGYDLIRSGELEHYRVGRDIYISRRAQKDFIARREARARAEIAAKAAADHE